VGLGLHRTPAGTVLISYYFTATAVNHVEDCGQKCFVIWAEERTLELAMDAQRCWLTLVRMTQQCPTHRVRDILCSHACPQVLRITAQQHDVTTDMHCWRDDFYDYQLPCTTAGASSRAS
jgi:hypothetical protein